MIKADDDWRDGRPQVAMHRNRTLSIISILVSVLIYFSMIETVNEK